MTSPPSQHFITSHRCDAVGGRTLPVFKPAAGTEMGRPAHAGVPDLERAAQKGFDLWRDIPARERSATLCQAAAPWPEPRFGGAQDSSHGAKGGPQALQACLSTETVSVFHA